MNVKLKPIVIFSIILHSLTLITICMGNLSATKTVSLAESKTMANDGESYACFGAGCYWGTEKYFKKEFKKYFPNKGEVTWGKVGFMGPTTAKANPSYREVCSGSTGHVEVYNFKFTGGNEAYEALTRFFFQFHDPTTLNSQGNDQVLFSHINRHIRFITVIICMIILYLNNYIRVHNMQGVFQI